jgi:ERCC4-type nuclease
MVNIKIDNREGALKALVKDEDGVIYENLPLGDIVISFDESTTLVFERKTYSDLLASISDGRYKSQKLRLLDAYPAANIYYILEGTHPSFAQHQGDSNVIAGVIVNTLLRDKIGLFYTRDVNDTYQLIQHIVKRIKADPKKYVCLSESHNTEIQIPKKMNHHNSTFKNILATIPGVSNKSADAIMTKWSSFQSMYQDLLSQTHDEKTKTLSSIATKDSKGKSRKVSCTVVTNIIQSLFDNDQNLATEVESNIKKLKIDI